MALPSLILCATVLAAASAYNEYYYRNFYNPSFKSPQNRRIDQTPESGRASVYESQINARVTNERSIPYRTDMQTIQDPRTWGSVRAAEELQPRNGNMTYKLGNSIVKNLPSVSSRRGQETESDSAVVFPGPTSRNSMFEPEIPKECEELGLCDSIPNYPYEHVDKLINETGNLTYFNMDILTPEISQRRGSEHKEVLCDSREEIIYPEAARNIKGEWVIIVNRKKVKVQGFKVEICSKPDKQCNPLAFVGEQYRLECGQKTTQRAMWSVNKSGYMVMEIVSTPSCCACVIRDNKA